MPRLKEEAPPQGEATTKIHVDVKAIPEFHRRELAQSVLVSLKQALAELGAEEEFQAWLREYKKERGARTTRRKE